MSTHNNMHHSQTMNKSEKNIMFHIEICVVKHKRLYYLNKSDGS